jgi:hypothetical protein
MPRQTLRNARALLTVHPTWTVADVVRFLRCDPLELIDALGGEHLETSARPPARAVQDGGSSTQRSG